MVVLSRGLKRGLLITAIILFAAGCASIGVSVFFLSSPIMRRNVVIRPYEIYCAMSIGIVMTISSIFFFLVYFLNHNSNIFLNLFRLLIVLVLLVTLALGAYIWFQSLNIQSDYSLRWLEWDNKLKKVFQDTDFCCGYKGPDDNALLEGYCSDIPFKNQGIKGCSEPIYNFVNSYLQNIYTALFFYAAIDFVSILMCLVTMRALEDQKRYEKSMKKMINIHNLDDGLLNDQEYENEDEEVDEDHSYENHEMRYTHYKPRPHKRESHLPAPYQRASVIYSYT